MALFASDITGSNQSTRILDLDAGTTVPRIVPFTALLLAIAALMVLAATAGTAPAPSVGRLVVQRDTLTLPVVATVRRAAGPGAGPGERVGRTVSARDSVRLAVQDVVTRAQAAPSREVA